MANTEWTDDTLMTFGKYKGQPIKLVPVEYLHWFYHNVTPIEGKDSMMLMNYCKKYLSFLKDENKDLIWERK